jgi:hypothetical protein
LWPEAAHSSSKGATSGASVGTGVASGAEVGSSVAGVPQAARTTAKIITKPATIISFLSIFHSPNLFLSD